MPNRTHSCEGSESGGEDLEGRMPVWPERPEREDGPRSSSCWPLRSCQEVRLPLRTMESEIKFGFLKDLPTSVWG